MNQINLDGENLPFANFSYPKQITEIVDDLYDTGRTAEADKLLAFLDELGEMAVLDLADLEYSVCDDSNAALREPLRPILPGQVQLSLFE